LPRFRVLWILPLLWWSLHPPKRCRKHSQRKRRIPSCVLWRRPTSLCFWMAFCESVVKVCFLQLVDGLSVCPSVLFCFLFFPHVSSLSSVLHPQHSPRHSLETTLDCARRSVPLLLQIQHCRRCSFVCGFLSLSFWVFHSAFTILLACGIVFSLSLSVCVLDVLLGRIRNHCAPFNWITRLR
jgi:hypothetical protein